MAAPEVPAPPAQGSTKTRKNRPRKAKVCASLAIAAGLVVVLLVAGFAWLGWFGGRQQPSAAADHHPRPQADRMLPQVDKTSPRAVADEFVRSTQNKDFTRLKQLTDGKLDRQLSSGLGSGGSSMLLKTASIDSHRIGPVHVHGDQAHVRMREHVSSLVMHTSVVLRMTMRKHAGSWQITDVHPEHRPAALNKLPGH